MENTRHKIPVSVNLILEKNNSILFSLRQGDCVDGGLWGFVAGHLEAGETPKIAMVREAKEELNIVIDPEDLLPPTMVYGSNPEYLGFVFRCARWQGEIQNLEPNKCTELRFFELNGLPGNIVGYVKKSIECVFEGIPYIEIDQACL